MGQEAFAVAELSFMTSYTPVYGSWAYNIEAAPRFLENP